MVDKLKARTEPLFARIPASLKRNLVASAKARGASVEQELARLLEERFDSGLSASLQRRVDEFGQAQRAERAVWLEKYQIFLEAHLLECVTAAQKGDISALVKLGNDVRAARRNRQRGLAGLNSRIEARKRESLQEQAAKDEAARVRQNFAFDTGGPIEDFQLPPEERRRRNLIAQLEKMPVGTKKNLALRLGWRSMSRVSHILTPKGKKGHRPISAALAKEIAEILEIDVEVLNKIERDRDLAEITHHVSKLEKLVDDIAKVGPRSK
ncbi:hypothetical protein BconGalA64_37230 [Burkholderia contaminans]|uniref:hypothetical protein n=1 Tax=Burkholderia contaminans TaxID=488447 RepID=UPI0030892F06|nr:hypothetical protein BconGalA64_37230 [Burkholderia contaminans]